jgi:anti-sigma factor RsiW
MFINEDILWDYADGLLSPAERLEVDALLRSDPALQAQLQEVLAFRAQMHAIPLEKPRAGFADGVMAAWAGEQLAAYQPPPNRDWMVFGVAGAFGLFIVGALASAIASLPWPKSVQLPFKMPQWEWPDWDFGALSLDARLLQLLVPALFTVLALTVLDKYLRHRHFLQNLEEV